MSDNSQRPATALRSVGRAAADLRRGLCVALRDDKACVALLRAAENIADGELDAMRDLAGGIAGAQAHFVITGQRADILHVVHRHATVCLEIEDRFDAAALAVLADPASDLDFPLRGPFAVNRSQPSAATEAATGLCKIARLLPAAVVVSGGGEAGERLAEWASANDVLSAHAADISSFPETEARALTQVTSAHVPLAEAANARIIAFRPADGGVEHLAIIIGDPPRDEPVLTRLHSECFTGDLLGSLKCDCGEQLRGAISQMSEAGSGILLYLAQEGRGIGLINKLRAYALQDQGFDTIDANERLGFEADERVFLPAAEMLDRLGYSRVRLMTNNPLKVDDLSAGGIEIVERVAHSFPSNAHNELYLATKRQRSGHLL